MNTFRIAWIAVRELMFEKVFYLFLGFAGMALGFSLLLGQLTYADHAKLTTDFMLGGIQLCLILFSIFMGISLFQRELAQGSVSMVLSKPIGRYHFLLGKFLGQAGVSAVLCSCMAVVTWGVCRAYNPQFASLPVFQSCFLIFCESLVLTAITYFFAVQSGALTAALATLVLFALGHLREALAQTVHKELSEGWVWKLTFTAIPDLEAFNTKALASYGVGISSTEVALALAYCGVVVAFYLSLAVTLFEQKDILT